MGTEALKTPYLRGLKDGVPIGLGYFAVAFSLGIAARAASLTALEGFLASLFTSASAGEFAVFSLIAAAGTLPETALMSLIVNARYLLMSCVLTQKLEPGTRLWQRLLLGFGVTDEIFAVSAAQPGRLDVRYSFGAMTAAIPLWAAGTAAGVITGNLLPVRAVSALGVSLFGMFLAVIFGEARKNRTVLGVIVASAAVSWGFRSLPLPAFFSDSMKTMILTVGLAALAAWLFPRKGEEEDE